MKQASKPTSNSQHMTLPDDSRAHEWRRPATTARALATLSPTLTGAFAWLKLPPPSWPHWLNPEQATLPAWVTAQV
jgi:hypothetical protein